MLLSAKQNFLPNKITQSVKHSLDATTQFYWAQQLIKMFRKSLIESVVTIRGRPWKKRGNPITLHAADRPPQVSTINFASLGLTHTVNHEPTPLVKMIHWTEPPKTQPDLPFFIERTTVSNSLPVYTEFKAGRTKVTTILRKVRGDIATLKTDMEKVCGREVEVHPGKLVVNGNYHVRLKRWLAGLGF